MTRFFNAIFTLKVCLTEIPTEPTFLSPSTISIESVVMIKIFIKKIYKKIKRRVRRYLAQIASLPSQIAWGLTKSQYVDQAFFLPRYYNALKAHQPKLPTLEWKDQQIVNSLQSKGICITSLESLELSNSKEFIKAAQQIAQRLKERAAHFSQHLPTEKYHEIHATKKELINHPEIFNWSINQRLLRIVESYIVLPVAYDGIHFFLSVANGEEYGARAWHRDREDRRMVKVCVYLNDVDEWGGPLQCLKPKVNDYACTSINHRYRSVHQEEMETLCSYNLTDAMVSCVGKVGTVIFIDTARFYHRGKPPIDFDRVAVFFSYFSRSPWHPFFCERFPLSLKEMTHLAPELTKEQWESVTWRKDLPKAVRWIPKSLI